jgi:starch synthase (maltosyl-transferring)
MRDIPPHRDSKALEDPNAHNGRLRVVIEAVSPEIDGGRFPIKRIVGDQVVVEADILADGHDVLGACLMYRKDGERKWTEVPMQPLVNDRWTGAFEVAELGVYWYTLAAWVDDFESWRTGLAKKSAADQDVSVDLLTGAQLIAEAGKHATKTHAKTIRQLVGMLRSTALSVSEKTDLALSKEVSDVLRRYAERRFATTYPRELEVVVDREEARFSAWYEMFPRSCAPAAGRHGTFKDCESRLAYVSAMGFNVLYLPPIHPIGVTNRKGKNNTPEVGPDDPGSPWAIGGPEGGHKAIHPQLGSLKEFQRLVAKAAEYNIEIALDLAFNCTPDHPYVEKHPGWFRHRPDGSVQYAENPPKKYQDIYPFDFETEEWHHLWDELKSIVLFWIQQGVRIFRVDNPHTKPFVFWEWLIRAVKREHPDIIFLSEAFTRPKVMYHLAKLGFTQSYTYFAWRNTTHELTQYFTELTQTEIREFFRPNLWPNTPDILTEYLQFGGRSAFMARMVLAATLGASYGIYGPAFELMENRPKEPGSEEYLNSEKYEVKHWDIDNPDSLRGFIGRVNYIRKDNPALQNNRTLRFHGVDNEQLICYSKHTEDLSDIILVFVNLDPHHVQSGWVDLSLASLGLAHDQAFQVHDLLSDSRYSWHGSRNFVELDPHSVPAHIFRIRKRVRTERDFDYFL